jgi:hypothetical protein
MAENDQNEAVPLVSCNYFNSADGENGNMAMSLREDDGAVHISVGSVDLAFSPLMAALLSARLARMAKAEAERVQALLGESSTTGETR